MLECYSFHLYEKNNFPILKMEFFSEKPCVSRGKDDKEGFPKNTERKKTSVAALKDLLELKCSIGGTKSANFVTLFNGGIVINKFSSKVQ